MKVLIQATSITAISIAGSGLGFLVQLLLARQYGTGSDVDMYLFALSAPTFLAGVATSFLSYGVVPRIAALPALGADQANCVAAGFSAVLLGAGAFLVLGLPVSAALVQTIPHNSALASHPDLAALMGIAWMLGAAQLMQGYLVAVLNAIRKHAAAAWLALLPPALTVLVLAITPGRPGIWIVGVGMLAGTLCAVASAAFTVRGLLRRIEAKPVLKPLFGSASSATGTVIALSCFASFVIVDAFWAPRAGDGALASLGYAQRIVIALGSLVVASPSAMLAPRLAALLAQHRYAKFKRELRLALVVVGLACIILAAALNMLADPLVQLLFKRGAFHDNDAQQIATTLRHMTPGMAAMVFCVVLFRVVFCLPQATWWAAALGAGWTAAYFAGSSFLHVNGPTGIAQAYSSAWLAVVFLLGAYVFLRVRAMPVADKNEGASVSAAAIEGAR